MKALGKQLALTALVLGLGSGRAMAENEANNEGPHTRQTTQISESRRSELEQQVRAEEERSAPKLNNARRLAATLERSRQLEKKWSELVTRASIVRHLIWAQPADAAGRVVWGENSSLVEQAEQAKKDFEITLSQPMDTEESMRELDSASKKFGDLLGSLQLNLNAVESFHAQFDTDTKTLQERIFISRRGDLSGVVQKRLVYFERRVFEHIYKMQSEISVVDKDGGAAAYRTIKQHQKELDRSLSELQRTSSQTDPQAFIEELALFYSTQQQIHLLQNKLKADLGKRVMVDQKGKVTYRLSTEDLFEVFISPAWTLNSRNKKIDSHLKRAQLEFDSLIEKSCEALLGGKASF